MMSKPAPEAAEEEEAPPAFAAPPAAKTGSVEDLERRLAMLGDAEDAKKPAAVAAAPVNTDALQAPPTVQAPAAAAPAAVKGGKNALLVRLVF